MYINILNEERKADGLEPIAIGSTLVDLRTKKTDVPFAVLSEQWDELNR